MNIDKLIEKIKENDENWDKFGKFFVEQKVKPKVTLLNAGEIANYVH